jgi:thiosulfate reductase cytochrome b subunit
MHSHRLFKQPSLSLILVGLALVAGAALVFSQAVLARTVDRPVEQVSPLHPTFALLDETGANVLDTGNPISTMQTCGQCHDTDFIAQHSFHADAGLSEFVSAGSADGLQPWDSSPGYFGRWDPLTYRYLSPAGEPLDLGTAAWIMLYGSRHAGGGPAMYSRDGRLLTELPYTPGDPETNIIDPETGEMTAWDWQASGVVEMNCFLCHTPAPDNEARIAALQAGEFRWAGTATMVGSGIVEQSQDGYVYNPAAFQENGELLQDFVNIQDPTNANCGQCHGLVHEGVSEPLVVSGCSDPSQWRTYTTGQIISAQRLDDSGMNLQNKDSLARSWDVHAERQVDCTDCHYALNNPVYYQESAETRPDYLTFDPRRMELGEYLYQPLHQFARGSSAQTGVAAATQDTMRRCDSCHNADTSHTWLPYAEKHMNAVSCETCHVAQIYSGAVEYRDWTVLTLAGEPNQSCRGVEGDVNSLASLVTGYQPVWLPSQDYGKTSLAPFNLVTAWYWVAGDPPRPVALAALKAAWLDGNQYRADILATFDANGDDQLDSTELILDTPEKQALIATHLEQLGLENPRILGEVQPYNINHNVAGGDWAIRDCRACHSDDSRITQAIRLADYAPAGVMPALTDASNTQLNGRLFLDDDGALYYQPTTEGAGLYVLGHDNVGWIDFAGGLIFAGTLLGVAVHGSLRYSAAKRQPPRKVSLRRVYMYAGYERLWHWLQTFTIIGLLFTGLVIHHPDTFGMFSFSGVVLVHNILAAILAVNAALSLFYHLASGQIRQFIPRPAGFFDQAIEQAIFYVRGIFKGEHHPFEKTPEKKLNPLQQITYFGLLNVLLPLQGITGIMMWGAQHWPDLAQRLGGLPFLAPLHTIVAWLFASFIVLHVYLTTTGHIPLTDIKAMVTGWDELEVPVEGEEATPSTTGLPEPAVVESANADKPQNLSSPNPEVA